MSLTELIEFLVILWKGNIIYKNKFFKKNLCKNICKFYWQFYLYDCSMLDVFLRHFPKKWNCMFNNSVTWLVWKVILTIVYLRNFSYSFLSPGSCYWQCLYLNRPETIFWGVFVFDCVCMIFFCLAVSTITDDERLRFWLNFHTRRRT